MRSFKLFTKNLLVTLLGRALYGAQELFIKKFSDCTQKSVFTPPILNSPHTSMFVASLGLLDTGLFGTESEAWINVHRVHITGKHTSCPRMKDIHINPYYGERGLK